MNVAPISPVVPAAGTNAAPDAATSAFGGLVDKGNAGAKGGTAATGKDAAPAGTANIGAGEVLASAATDAALPVSAAAAPVTPPAAVRPAASLTPPQVQSPALAAPENPAAIVADAAGAAPVVQPPIASDAPAKPSPADAAPPATPPAPPVQLAALTPAKGAPHWADATPAISAGDPPGEAAKPAATTPAHGDDDKTAHDDEGEEALPAAATAIANPVIPVPVPLAASSRLTAQATAEPNGTAVTTAIATGAAASKIAPGSSAPADAPRAGGIGDVAQNLPPLIASQAPGASIPVSPAAGQPYPAETASNAVAAQPGRIGRETGIEIARHVAAGRDDITIRLTPAEMGRIDVRLSFDDKGALHAVVRADNPASLDMLRREAGDLSRSLADAGIRADTTSFSFDSRGGAAGQFAQQQQPRGASPGTPAGSQLADEGDAAPAQFQPLRTSSRIDLMA